MKICFHKWEGLTIQVYGATVVGKKCKKCGKMTKALKDLEKALEEKL